MTYCNMQTHVRQRFPFKDASTFPVLIHVVVHGSSLACTSYLLLFPDAKMRSMASSLSQLSLLLIPQDVRRFCRHEVDSNCMSRIAQGTADAQGGPLVCAMCNM